MSALPCAVSLTQDRDTQRVYRLCDFTTAQLTPPDEAHTIAGKVNSVDGLHLVIESIRPDTKHARCSNVPVPVDGAGGSGIGQALRSLVIAQSTDACSGTAYAPAPMHLCARACRRTTFRETKPAIVRVVYFGTNKLLRDDDYLYLGYQCEDPTS